MSVIGIRSNPNYPRPIQQTELILLKFNNGIISPTPHAIHRHLLGEENKEVVDRDIRLVLVMTSNVEYHHALKE